jgi:uncharacterized SAM-binding protein YcdF (DUF218 family)
LSRKKRFRTALVLAIGVAACGLLATVFLPRQLLVIDSGDVQADAIVVLGGGSGERVERAAELFKAGAAPGIFTSGAGDAEDNRRLLENRGVPAGAIQVEPNSKSTRQNALFTVPLLRAQRARRVILVTSWYHSRRALKCFRHYASDIQFYSRPSYFGYPGRAPEGERRALRRYVYAEYVKLLGYWVCYGVGPW